MIVEESFAECCIGKINILLISVALYVLLSLAWQIWLERKKSSLNKTPTRQTSLIYMLPTSYAM